MQKVRVEVRNESFNSPTRMMTDTVPYRVAIWADKENARSQTLG